MSVILALSIDYSLFVLSRYREELIKSSSTTPYILIIEKLLSSSGHIILVSGSTLTICFLCTLILPLSFIRAIGLGFFLKCSTTRFFLLFFFSLKGAAISIICVLIANLTISPAILFIFPNFFRRCIDPIKIRGKECCGVNEKGENYGSEMPTQSLLINSGTEEEQISFGKKSKGKKNSCWRNLGFLTQKKPYNFLFLLLALAFVIPFAIFSFRFTTTNSLLYLLPRGTPITNNYIKMVNFLSFVHTLRFQFDFHFNFRLISLDMACSPTNS